MRSAYRGGIGPPHPWKYGYRVTGYCNRLTTAQAAI